MARTSRIVSGETRPTSVEHLARAGPSSPPASGTPRELLLVDVAEVDEELAEVLARIVRGRPRPRSRRAAGPSSARCRARRPSVPLMRRRASSSTSSASGSTAKLPMRPRIRARVSPDAGGWRQAGRSCKTAAVEPHPNHARAEPPPAAARASGSPPRAALLVAVAAYLAYDRLVTQPALARAAILGLWRGPHRRARPADRARRRSTAPASRSPSEGQVVFVNFWATWCPPCREEMPSMVAPRTGARGAAPGPVPHGRGLGRRRLGPGEGVLRRAALLREARGSPSRWTPTRWRRARTTADARRGACPDLKFPETYIVDRNGRLVAFVVGPRDWSDPSARLLLESIIGS